MAMYTDRNSVIVLLLICLMLMRSEVIAQRSRGSSSLSRLSRMASGLSSLGSQQDVLSLANSHRGRGSFGNSLLAEMLGYRGRGQGRSYQLDGPDAAYIRNSLRSRNHVSQNGDIGRGIGMSGGSRGFSDFSSNFGRSFDQGLALNSLDRLSSSFNRYDSIRNAFKDSLGLDLRSGLSSFGGGRSGGGGGFDMGRGAGDFLSDRMGSLSQLDFGNSKSLMPSSMLGSQGLNMQSGPQNLAAGSNVVRGVMAQSQPATATIVRTPTVHVQQPANAIVGVAAQSPSTSYANIPTANVVSTIVQPAANVVPVIQQAATSNIVPIMQPASVMVQQASRVVPVVSVAAQPVQTMLHSLSQPQTISYGGLGGIGNGLGRGLFSNMPPVIVKMEDIPSFPRSSHELPSNSPAGRGSGHATRDPNISVVKLDEGLSIVVNYSDPYGTIMNLPAPTNEEEANLLKKVLETAEAPEYLKSMIRIRPRPMPAPVAGLPANSGAPAHVAVAQPAMPVVPAPAVAVAAPAAAVAAPAAVPVAPAIVPAPAAQQVAQMVPGTHQFVATGTYAAYDDVSIDEIIAGTMIPVGGPAAAVGGSNYPLDSPTRDGRFVLTALDMELTQQQYAELQSPTAFVGGRKKRKALASSRMRWTGGVIPFEIQGMGFSPADHQQILNAMSQWSQSTCITFRPATATDANKLVFRDGKGCSSNVGMIGGVQYLTLQKECRIPKILAHEIGHALGLIHEHQRDDRDNFIRINYLNIKPGTEKDFDQFKMGSIDHSLSGYDYMSIMHYGKTAFARDKNLVTMEAIDPKFTHLMGTARTLSPSDYNTVNSMYGCAGAGGLGVGGGLGLGVGMNAGMMAAAAVPVAPAASPVQSLVTGTGTQIVAAAPANTVLAAPAQTVIAAAPAQTVVAAAPAQMAAVAPLDPNAAQIPTGR